MDPLIGYGLMQGAGSLLGFLGGSGERKRGKQEYGDLRSRLLSQYGKDPMDIDTIMAHLNMAQRPKIQEMGKMYDRRFGWDSGRAAGGLGQAIFGEQSQIYGDLAGQEARMKQSNQQNSLAGLLQLYGSRFGG